MELQCCNCNLSCAVDYILLFCHWNNFRSGLYSERNRKNSIFFLVFFRKLDRLFCSFKRESDCNSFCCYIKMQHVQFLHIISMLLFFFHLSFHWPQYYNIACVLQLTIYLLVVFFINVSCDGIHDIGCHILLS